MADPQASSPQDLLSSLAYQTGGLGAIPQIQRSQYLAQALQNLQEGSAKNIQTKGALGSNLLADAILQFSRGRNNQQLEQAIGQGMQGTVAANTAGTGLDPSAAGAGGPPMPAAPPGGGIAPAPAAPPPAAPAVAPAGAGLASAIQGGSSIPPDVIKTIIQEDPTHAAMIASVIANRAAQGHETLEQVVSDRNQFGMGSVAGSGEHANWNRINADPNAQPGSKLYQQVEAQAGPILSGVQPPAGPYTGFYSPSAGQKFGENKPSWDDGTGTQVGGNLFFSHPYAGFPHAQPEQSPQIGAPPGSAPYQVASNGPTPAPPMNQLGVPAATPQTQGGPFPPPPPPPGPSAGVPVGGIVPPQAGPINANTPPPLAQAMQPRPQGPPTGLQATPQEMALYQRLNSFPVGSAMWERGQQLATNIQQRAMTPIAPPKDMQWDQSQGRFAPLPGTQFTNGPGPAPGTTEKISPFGEPTISAVPNAVQNGQVYDQGRGGFVPLPGLQPQTSGSLLPGTVTSQTPGSAPTVVQQPNFDPEKTRQAFAGSPQVQQYTTIHRVAEGFSNAIANAAGKNNGVLGTAGVDAVIQSFGLNPRAASAKDLAANMGLPEAIQTRVAQLFGPGGATVDGMKQMFSVIQSEDQAARAAAQRMQQSDTAAGGPAYAKGVPGEAELLPPAVSMPSFAAFNPQAQHPAPPAGMNAQQALQEGRKAILAGKDPNAVKARLQAWGVNPAGL